MDFALFFLFLGLEMIAIICFLEKLNNIRFIFLFIS